MLDNKPPPDSRAAKRHASVGPKRNTAARVARNSQDLWIGFFR